MHIYSYRHIINVSTFFQLGISTISYGKMKNSHRVYENVGILDYGDDDNATFYEKRKSTKIKKNASHSSSISNNRKGKGSRQGGNLKFSLDTKHRDDILLSHSASKQPINRHIPPILPSQSSKTNASSSQKEISEIKCPQFSPSKSHSAKISSSKIPPIPSNPSNGTNRNSSRKESNRNTHLPLPPSKASMIGSVSREENSELNILNYGVSSTKNNDVEISHQTSNPSAIFRAKYDVTSSISERGDNTNNVFNKNSSSFNSTSQVNGILPDQLVNSKEINRLQCTHGIFRSFESRSLECNQQIDAKSVHHKMPLGHA